MKFLLLSDVHATTKTPIGRKDNILETFKKKIDFIFDLAKERDAHILQAGDLFDKPRDWYLLLYFMRKLKNSDIKIHTIYGQHDMYMYSNVGSTPTTLGILSRAGYLKILTKKPTVIGKTYIKGASWGNPIPLANRKARTNILVMHYPISKKDLYPGHDFTSPLHFIKKHAWWDLILVGDIHRHFIEKTKATTMINTGPMLRLEASEYNMEHKPCAYIFDDEYLTVEKVTIPHEEADTVLSRSHIDNMEDLLEEELQFGLDEDFEPDDIDIHAIIYELIKKAEAGKRVSRIIGKAFE